MANESIHKKKQKKQIKWEKEKTYAAATSRVQQTSKVDVL
jgi:hypothetical protein